MQLGRTAALHFAAQVVTTLAGFAATWLIAFYLGADGLGLYAVAVSIGFYWMVIPANAVASAIRKRTSEGDDSAGYLGGGLILSGIIAVVGAVLVLVAGELLGGLVSRDREIMRVLITYNVEIATLFLAAVGYRTAVGALDGQKRVAETGGLQAGERIGRTVLQVAALTVGLGVGGLTFGHAGSLLGVAAVGFLLSNYRPTLPTIDQLKSLLSYAKFAWVGALQGRVFGWLDTIVLSFFVGASLIGIYEAAWGIASMLAMASTSISKTLFPEVSDISSSAEFDQIRHYLDEALAFSGVFVIPGLFGATVLGERVLRFYRPEFGMGTDILLILIVAYTADVYAAQLLSVINAVDRPDAAFRINIVFILVNVLSNIILVWQFGWYGAAFATAGSTLLRTVAGYVALRKIIGRITVPFGEISRQLGASVVMATAVWLLTRRVSPGRIGTLLLVGFGAAVYTLSWLTVSRRARNKIQLLLPFSV